jgi:hypothetical protein
MLRLRTVFLGTALSLVAITAVMVAGDQHARAVSLQRGWNNVSYLGAAKSPADALSSLSGQYSSVYRWDAGTQAYQLYAPGAPAFANSLSQLNPGDAVWLNYTQNTGNWDTGTLNQAGTPSGGTGKLSIAASTFLPMNDLAIYEKNFNQIAPVGTDAASQRYYAPVYLPNGATITSMTAAYAGSGDTVAVRLDYTPLANGDASANVYKLAEVLSSGGSSPQTQSAFSHTVDNGANVYFIVVDLKGGPASKLMGVSIAYTY